MSAVAAPTINASLISELCASMTLSDWIYMTNTTNEDNKQTTTTTANILHMLCSNPSLDLPIIEALQVGIKTCRDDRNHQGHELRPDILSALASTKNADGILPLHLLCANAKVYYQNCGQFILF
jgi:hypothetical protein